VSGEIDARALLEVCTGRVPEMLEDLRLLVEHESPSSDPALLEELARVLGARLEVLGGALTAHRAADGRPHLELRLPGRGDGGALVLCHMDTVHPEGTLERCAFRVAGGRAHGPGTQDMKGGIVIGLHALAGLRALGLTPARPVTMLITSDEEIGSPSSRALVEGAGRACSYALVLEPAGVGGALKTARKGVGAYRLEVTGRAAHAGLHFDRGVNAVLEMALLLPGLHALSDPARGTTVNIGLLRGGSAANVVPERCTAEVDVRFFETREAERVEAALRSLEVGRGARVEIAGGVNRPPLERTEGVARLFGRARELALRLGRTLEEAAVGGASDGNLVAGILPVLDGLGPEGAGLHTPDEYLEVDSLPFRAALVGGLLASL
jgi:glutamate carboxypeptidase